MKVSLKIEAAVNYKLYSYFFLSFTISEKNVSCHWCNTL